MSISVWRAAWLCWMLVIAGAMCLSSPAVAQDADAGEASSPGTGDAWIDAALLDIDAYARRHRDAYVDELARYQAAPRALIEEVLAGDVTPGDVYYGCALAQALGRPCREVLDTWRGDASEGWEGVARALAPEHAADARARVKRGIVRSYDRWARPITLDASLRRAFPDRRAPGSG